VTIRARTRKSDAWLTRQNTRLVTSTQPRRYACDDPQAATHLHELGYVVFDQVISPAQCQQALARFWEWIGEVTSGRVLQSRLESYRYWPPSLNRGAILAYCGIGQSEFCWGVRDRPEIRKAFATLWQDDDLLVSFDGACVMRPWHYDLSWKSHERWFHVDQHPGQRPGFDCVQGLVNLLPMSSDGAGNLLIEGSHHVFSDYAERYPDVVATLPTAEDYFEIPLDDPVLTGPSATPVRVFLRPGDMLCWDSRTAHCNSPGSSGRAVDTLHQLSRAAVFVCMVPRTRASASLIKTRKKVVSRQITTTHRPHIYGPTHEYTDWQMRIQQGNTLPNPALPATMTAARLRLIGYSDKEALALAPTNAISSGPPAAELPLAADENEPVPE